MAGKSRVNPGDETGRLAALRRYAILDSEQESEFDEITRVAAAVCDKSIALVSLIDERRQWFKSKHGLNIDETARDIAFCDTAIRSGGLMEIQDARQDPRFESNPLVTNEPHIRFYAGVPLTTPDGYRIGTLCVIDREPGKLTDLQRDALKLLADKVMDRLELRSLLRETNQARAEISATAAMQKALLASRKQSERFMRATIDALPDNIAIVDSQANIVHVNASWSEFAQQNGGDDLVTATGTGVNYIEVCERSAARGSADAAMVRDALRDILAGADEPFEMEYPCHSPRERRWFEMTVSPFFANDERHAIIAHRNVTERYESDQAIKSLQESLEDRVRDRTAELERSTSELRESEQRFRALFDNAELGALIFGGDCLLQRTNQAFEKIVRRQAREMVGRPLYEFVHADDSLALRDCMEQICAGRLPGGDLDFRIVLPDGETSWVHASISAINGEAGAFLQATALVQDISRRKDAERQRDRFFEQSVDMMVIADLDGSFHRVNPACERILGYSTDELQQSKYLDLAHPDDYKQAKEKVEALGRGENVDLLDVRMRTASGQYRDIRWNASPWTAEGLVLAIGRDVTSIRAAERAILEKGDMLARAEQMSQMGSLHWDAGSDTVNCSNGLLWIAGLPGQDAPATAEEIPRIFSSDDRQRVQTSIERAYTKKQSSQQLLRIRRPDGSTRVVQSFFSPGKATNGGSHGVTAAFRDTTDFSDAIARLRESQRELRALTKRMEEVREEERAALSREIHDELGQMLTALKIDITLLGRDVAPETGSVMEAGQIAESLSSMEELVNSIIGSVRRIAQRMRPEVLDSFGLVPAIEWHAREFQKRTNIECSISSPTSHPELAPDVRTALFRITQEAMTNVARHAEADRIDISVTYADGTLELHITDNGRGIEPDRLAGTASLGLLGMRERATMVGGVLDISGEPGKGTRVHVRLPVNAPRTDARNDPRKSDSAS